MNPSEPLSLSEYTGRIADTLNGEPELQRQWVVAETSEANVRRGHCYLDLIEKDPDTGLTRAKLQAVVWASTFGMIAAKFESVAGRPFGAGIKVMLLLNAQFHPQYGLKAIVSDINPEYTLGDMARLRQEIIARLTREGIIDANRELPVAAVPQRIAVVSAPNAAGYGDFVNQLHNNHHHLQYYTTLFPAIMQGERTVESVLGALDRIVDHCELFDCVVIIRGGGATSDLQSFENYDLAAAIAQFPLPVVVGIGHDRDQTVLDLVAHQSVKTPTAAAEWLLDHGTRALQQLDSLATAVAANAREILGHARQQLAYYNAMIPAAAQRVVENRKIRLASAAQSIPATLRFRMHNEQQRLARNAENLIITTSTALAREQTRLVNLADKVDLLSPENTLRRGYALVADADGHYVTDAGRLTGGQQLTLTLSKGEARVTVDP